MKEVPLAKICTNRTRLWLCSTHPPFSFSLFLSRLFQFFSLPFPAPLLPFSAEKRVSSTTFDTFTEFASLPFSSFVVVQKGTSPIRNHLGRVFSLSRYQTHTQHPRNVDRSISPKAIRSLDRRCAPRT